MPDWSWPEFEWDEKNEEHVVERHNVEPEEVEQVFHNGAQVRRKGDLYYVYGQDDAGRYLFIVCVLRGTVVRVVSARDMSAKDRRSYERRR